MSQGDMFHTLFSPFILSSFTTSTPSSSTTLHPVTLAPSSLSHPLCMLTVSPLVNDTAWGSLITTQDSETQIQRVGRKGVMLEEAVEGKVTVLWPRVLGLMGMKSRVKRQLCHLFLSNINIWSIWCVCVSDQFLLLMFLWSSGCNSRSLLFHGLLSPLFF